ncbi:DUF3306 domain-containing protein [Photobacterium sp. SDRW27]|uniref:DUF3306 domain-containing protein n=1 Tax=Photobacterium obscurum TaxID=2829490 RepID=UPI002244649B|nr:DUF3306 domain-containing protein [Photobacterium obscurum]MCW8327971.1 DUF3306 domain-containing protein [Photobacterium obscurum]
MATNFFQRWSGRKLAAREDVADSTPPDTDTVVDTAEVDVHISDIKQQPSDLCLESETSAKAGGAESESGSEPDLTSEEVSLTLKDVANVTFESGVSSFMKTGVEKSVKKAALRKLFHSDEFNYVSDMDDHTEDFSNVPTLDSNVTKQLRNWVNQAAEKIEEVADALDQSSSEGSGKKGSSQARVERESNPDRAHTETSEELVQGSQLDNEAVLGAHDAKLNELADRS